MGTTAANPMKTKHQLTPSTQDRIQKSLNLRRDEAERDAAGPAPRQKDNGDEARYADKCGTYSKGLKQDSIGRVNLAAYHTFKKALESGRPSDFNNITLGGPRTLNGPQGGLAFLLGCLDSSQFAQPPAPAMESEDYAVELMELYWASLLRDVAFFDYDSNAFAQAAAKELSSFSSYKGPRNSAKEVTPGLLFRGPFKGETAGPYLSQFLINDTSFGALSLPQKYSSNQAKVNFMMDKTTFQQVQNGIATGLSLTPTAPAYLYDGRGLTAYTHEDVLYQAYFIAYLVMNTINKGSQVPVNPGNPYAASTTQNGFATFGQPDFASLLATAASVALKAVWYLKWYVHLRHRPESGGAIVHLAFNPADGKVDGKLNPAVLNSQAVQTCHKNYKSYFLSQAFPEGSPTHPAYPTGHGSVAGACITILKFFFDGNFVIPKPLMPSTGGASAASYMGSDAGSLTVNGELNKLASNISFGHGIHSGIHWRSDTHSSIRFGEAVALSILDDLARTYNEKFTVTLQKVDGDTATILNEIHT